MMMKEILSKRLGIKDLIKLFLLFSLFIPRSFDETLRVDLTGMQFNISRLGFSVEELYVHKSVYLFDILLFLFFLFIFFRRRLKLPKWFIVYVTLLIFIFVNSIIIGANISWGVGGLIEYMRLPVIVLLVCYSERNKQERNILLDLIFIMFFLGIWGIIRFSFFYNIYNYNRLDTIGFSSNLFSQLNAILFPLVVIGFNNIKLRNIFFFISLVMLMAILLAGSRQGYLMFLLFLISYLMIILRSKDKRKFLTILSLIILPILIFYNFKKLQLFPTLRIVEYGLYDLNRIELAYGALKMWRMSPIWGIGPGNFLIKWGSISTLPSVYSYYWHPHNLYLMFLSETGIVGVSTFLWLLSKAIRACWFEYKFENSKLALSLGLALIIFLFGGFFDYILWDYRTTVVIGILIGVSISLFKKKYVSN